MNTANALSDTVAFLLQAADEVSLDLGRITLTMGKRDIVLAADLIHDRILMVSDDVQSVETTDAFRGFRALQRQVERYIEQAGLEPLGYPYMGPLQLN